ncbi:Ysy6p NDAI_0C05370 [Naumovozyma dairenensis CBS 421]|uniref:Stress-associated endoplasmic reticulum protein n=1 Tax=Naumovozyma dairenensis (strain ATCC 10597 / BCRC 20456 / CBS 421 / NBRC 0211 / NRRL Y-12639) TaxID=1071378 RepID=G0W8T5_NAUDC|nr:hypothetical protein NDAI_0C05370 [Naumovozyma dairenensis CBS 421]CCD24196.1 hypothetical protein NDAI_0C05370 [Naumovozyma dairenensis CBS 421]
MAIQTPKQRIANEKFNKNIEKHRKYGKKKLNKNDEKSQLPISKVWLAVILFLLIGGGVLELISFFF